MWNDIYPFSNFNSFLTTGRLILMVLRLANESCCPLCTSSRFSSGINSFFNSSLSRVCSKCPLNALNWLTLDLFWIFCPPNVQWLCLIWYAYKIWCMYGSLTRTLTLYYIIISKIKAFPYLAETNEKLIRVISCNYGEQQNSKETKQIY